MISAITILAAGLVGLTSAQNSNSTGSSFGYPYLISPNDPAITAANRTVWCSSQLNSCRQLCGGAASPNMCDGTTLTYSCGCQNGMIPNITAYEQTLPFFECLQYRVECVAATNDATAQIACNNIQCGTSGDPARVFSSLTAAMASPTSSAAASSSMSTSAVATSAAPAAASSTSHAAAPAMTMNAGFGTGALAVGAVALFGLGL